MGRKQAQALLAALISTPLAAQTYDPIAVTPQIIGSPQTMTPLNGGDDSTRLVELGFPFEYFGQVYTSAWVSTNGFVSFESNNHLCCNGFEMVNAQRNTIYGLWSDLISGGNPYYRVDGTSALFGWYNTNEYGTNLTNTFEIALYADGRIQWNYGDVNNQYHVVSAGLTGPTMEQSISLFYGQNVNLLDNTSYATGASAPQPEPEPVFAPVTAVPEVVPNPVTAATAMTVEEEQQFEDAVVAAEQAMEAQAAQEPAETVAETVVETQVEETPTATETAEPAAEEEEQAQSEQEAEESTEEKSETASASPASAPPPPGFNPVGSSTSSSGGSGSSSGQELDRGTIGTSRRDRAVDLAISDAIEDAAASATSESVIQIFQQDLAFVAQADAQYAQQFGEQTTTETLGVTYSLQPTDGPTFLMVSNPTASDVTSPAGQAQQMELLNMGGMQTEMAAGEPKDIGDVNTEDSETMAQLAVVPVGYSTYTQARIPDVQFYLPKDIYKNRRIPDQNMALYRMMRGQDALWEEMVDEQYE
jgi:hypothetical protein